MEIWIEWRNGRDGKGKNERIDGWIHGWVYE